TQSNWSSFKVSLCSLSQELRVHLNHWSCLSSKVQSDHYLRPALVQRTMLLVEIKQTLDSLGLQALVLMEHYVYVILSAIAQTELDSVQREVLEDILAGTDMYNQAVEEQRARNSATQLRTAVLHRAHYSTLDSILPNSKERHPAAFSVKEMTMILAVHHAEMAAKQMQCWASTQSYQICQVHNNHDAYMCSLNSSLICGNSILRSRWTWEQLQHTYLISSSLFSINHHPALHSSSRHTCHNTPVYIPDLNSDSTVLENRHPVLAKPISVQHRTDDSNNDQTSQCQTYISQTGQVQTTVETLDSAQPNVERQSSLENCKLLQTISPPSKTFHNLSALPLSAVCEKDHSSVELLFQVLVSSSDLLASLVSHMSTPEAPVEKLLPSTKTDVLSANGKTDPMILGQNMTEHEGTQPEWAEQEITTRLEATGSCCFRIMDSAVENNIRP
ncbi:uncharacterized protein LOC120787271, partial [Xiphias gladius]|uniref:uncharacterized protein LOC120787271 n=1 Tax=Xiphias gladius TaxID=8245 RepID=UPI001A9817EF